MKKLLILFCISLMCVSISNAQTAFRFGANIGLPTGDVSDISSLQAGADIAYMFTTLPVLEVGPMIGYSHFFAKEGFSDRQFVPLAASGRANLAGFTVGLDVGYALGLSNGVDGGVYYRPQVGFNILMLGLIASYQGINTNGATFSSFNLGAEFKF